MSDEEKGIVDAGVTFLNTKVSDAHSDRPGKDANISGNRASREFLYGYAWPYTWFATWFGEKPKLDLGNKKTQRMVLGTLGMVVMTIITLLVAFLFALLYTCLYGIARAIFHSVFSISSTTPLAIGIGTGLIYLACFLVTRFVCQGLFTTWDTLAFAACGFVGHDRRLNTTIGSYLFNWLHAALYIGVQMLGGWLGAMLCDYFVKGSVNLGSPVPDNSLVGRDGPVIFWNLIATGFWVLTRLYFDNPSQLPHSKFGSVSGLVVMVVSISGAYLGNTGAFDLMAPLCHAIVAKEFKLFWATFVGQFIGTICGLLLFALFGLYHALQQLAASNEINATPQKWN